MADKNFKDSFAYFKKNTKLSKQAELAEIVGTAASNISAMKKEGRFSEKWVIKICKEYCIPADEALEILPDFDPRADNRSVAQKLKDYELPVGGDVLVPEMDSSDEYIGNEIALNAEYMSKIKLERGNFFIFHDVGAGLVPRVQYDDILLCKRCSEFIKDHIYVVKTEYGGKLTIKSVKIENNEVIISQNQPKNSYSVSYEEFRDMVVGIAIRRITDEHL